MLNIFTFYTLFILEGGVCSGKTSLSRNLSNNSFIIPEQTEFIPDSIEKIIFNMEQDIILSTILNTDKIRYDLTKKLLNKKLDVIMDRSILSTLGFYYATNQFSLVNDILYQEIQNLKNLEPIIIYIKLPYHERLRRILKRGDNSNKIKNSIVHSEEFNNKFDDFFINFLKKYNLNIITIDGSLSINETTKLIETYINPKD